MRFGKGLPLTAEQRAVHGIRADETLALHARIAELEHTSKCHVEGFVKQCEIANKQAHRIAELEAAAKLVEEWWLSEGKLRFDGAPHAMFALRRALEGMNEKDHDNIIDA